MFFSTLKKPFLYFFIVLIPTALYENLFCQSLSLCRELVGRSSITPHDGHIFDFLKKLLESKGFSVSIFTTEDTKNFYAHWCSSRGNISLKTVDSNSKNPHTAFVGHVDVVPPGDVQQWRYDPFSPTVDHHGIYGQSLYGRGTADMKGAIACFLAAAFAFQTHGETPGAISIILTSDEEGSGINGIRTLVPFLKEKNIQGFLVGEPTGSYLGEVLQVGRRGSLLGEIKVKGIQGHIACPEFFRNPVWDMGGLLCALKTIELDKGTPYFPPSHLEVVVLETSTKTTNVVPGECTARFGVRFNPLQSPESLEKKIRDILEPLCSSMELTFTLSGLPYYSEPCDFLSNLHCAVKDITNKDPVLTTKGGITDGRWLAPLGPVVEFGFPEGTIHQVDECIGLGDMDTLGKIYFHFLLNFFQ